MRIHNEAAWAREAGGSEGEGWRRGGVERDEGMHTKKTASPNGC